MAAAVAWVATVIKNAGQPHDRWMVTYSGGQQWPDAAEGADARWCPRQSGGRSPTWMTVCADGRHSPTILNSVRRARGLAAASSEQRSAYSVRSATTPATSSELRRWLAVLGRLSTNTSRAWRISSVN